MYREWGWRDCVMRGVRSESLKAATALAIIFATVNCLPATAGLSEDRAISAAIPLPEPADVAPPSAADVRTPAALTPQEVEQRVPLPESANLPPPSREDVGGPATAASDPKTSVPAAAPASAAPADVATQPPAAAPADENPVTAALRELVGSKLGRYVERKNDRAAVETFYVKRTFAPLWIENGEASARAKAAIAYLASVDAEGLEPSDYPTPVFRSGAEPAALAEADI